MKNPEFPFKMSESGVYSLYSSVHTHEWGSVFTKEWVLPPSHPWLTSYLVSVSSLSHLCLTCVSQQLLSHRSEQKHSGSCGKTWSQQKQQHQARDTVFDWPAMITFFNFYLFSPKRLKAHYSVNVVSVCITSFTNDQGRFKFIWPRFNPYCVNSNQTSQHVNIPRLWQFS